MKAISIAIDGHSSTGKSTLAKALAKKLGYRYVDSGAMYRAVTLFAMKNGWINGELDVHSLEGNLHEIRIDFKAVNGRNLTLLNGQIVEEEIRSLKVSNAVSQVSKTKMVREKLKSLQQDMASDGAVVMDGRDIGSAVLPNAELKIFMTADPKIRALRRFDELKSTGQDVSLEDVVKNIEERDYLDTTRKENPLIQVSDARVLDNSSLTEEEQLELTFSWASEIIQNLK